MTKMNTDSEEVPNNPTKMSELMSTPNRKLRNVTMNSKSISKIGRKVHSNINFSKLDEVCLDVGKVDLSRSAKLNNDSCLSPKKSSSETAGSINMNSKNINGHSKTNTGNSMWDTSKYSKKIRSCYVQLEGLEVMKSRGITNGASKRPHNKVGDFDREWRGWASNILFIERLGCELITVKEGQDISHVLVFGNGKAKRDNRFDHSRVSKDTINNNESVSSAAYSLPKKQNENGFQNENDQSFTFVKENDIEAHTSLMDKDVQNTNNFVMCSIKEDGFNEDENEEHVLDNSYYEKESEMESLGEDFSGSFLGWSGSSKHSADIECKKFMKYYKQNVKGIKG